MYAKKALLNLLDCLWVRLGTLHLCLRKNTKEKPGCTRMNTPDVSVLMSSETRSSKMFLRFYHE